MKHIITINFLLLSLYVHAQGQINFCYVIDQSTGELVEIDQDGGQQTPIAQIAECQVEAIAWDPIGGLWMFDETTGSFYTLDPSTGVSTFQFLAPTFVNSATGLVHQITDVDALDFDAFDATKLYCVERVPSPGADIFFCIDTTTGLVIGNTGFPVSGGPQLDIDDIAIDPLTSALFGIANTNGMGDQLVFIDITSGAYFAIGPLKDANGTLISDMEGLAFDQDENQLVGTTGKCSNFPSSLFAINKNNGCVSNLGMIGDTSCADFESIVCFVAEFYFPDIGTGPLTNANRDCLECPEQCENGEVCSQSDVPILIINDARCMGSIEVQGACPSGSILEYSVDNGPWDDDPPPYNEEMAEMISIRCRCDLGGSLVGDIVTESTDPFCCDADAGSFPSTQPALLKEEKNNKG